MTLVCRGIRGATKAGANTREAIWEATRELLQRLVEANGLHLEMIAAAFFTTTPDLNADFPATAARSMGWDSVPLLCAQEMGVPDALPLCIRVLLLVNTEKRPEEVRHIYLRGTEALRQRGGASPP